MKCEACGRSAEPFLPGGDVHPEAGGGSLRVGSVGRLRALLAGFDPDLPCEVRNKPF